VDDAIRDLARDAGVASDWVDANDRPQRVAVDTLRGVLTALGLPCATKADIAESRERQRAAAASVPALVTATAGTPISLAGLGLADDTAGVIAFENAPTEHITLREKDGRVVLPPIREPGYHTLRLGGHDITLAVAPPRCVTVDDVAPGEKLYGLAVQLYALRGRDDHGFGDTSALREFAVSAAREGADAIALSPVHSLFAADHDHYGPYSPSSRLFLNPLYADPAVVLGAERVTAVADSSKHEHGALIHWPESARTKFLLLARLFEDFRANDMTHSSALARDFAAFVSESGERLREHALFEALHAHWFGAPEPKWSWSDWPPDWRAPNTPAAARFAEAEPQAVQFHMFAQWLAARSFAAAQSDARDAGMRIGLISDIAIGMSPGGSHAWSRQQDLLPGLNVGAPPDLINSRGQDWGLTAFSPHGLKSSGYEPFIATLRAAMRHAGGVRIDHVMGLTRLWLIPRGASATDGAYLRYPLDDLLRLIALESHRHRAIVIGEDLGTVPPDFREQLAQAGIAGMDVLWFQRGKRGFLPPGTWRSDAVAMTTTHDLPTVAGWWTGADIAERARLGFVKDDAAEIEARAQDRALLWRAFGDAGVVAANEALPSQPEAAVDAAVTFAARSPGPLALIPIEDILGLEEQPNLPGTIDEHPNWRRRLTNTADEMLDDPAARRRLKVLRERK